MRTNVILTTSLIVLLTIGFAKVDLNQFSTNYTKNQTSSINQKGTTGKMVKAEILNDEIIPSMELPEVEIFGQRNTAKLLKAELIDGEIVSVIDLDEVVIRPRI